MKAELNAPSAKIARKWLGSRNATKKASAIGPAPSTAARTMSRTKPVSRERRGKPPTVKIRPIMGCFRSGVARSVARRSPLRRNHRGDNAVLRRLVEIWVHRQADHFGRKLFAHRQAALGDREAPVGILHMDRHRIVDRGRNALCPQRRRK